MSLLISVGPYIIVPFEVAVRLGADPKKMYRHGKYYVDVANTYIVCLLDLEDNPVVCLECDLYAEDGLNRIIIPMEYLGAADVTISAGRRCWKIEGKTGWIKNILEVEEALSRESEEALRYTPIHDLEKELAGKEE